ncbi:hypothetical protein [Bacillus cereus group sp. Bce001]|uniref:hypothetical protein n=1 Tax=Bacillus cereus group sp. Bce001 TaxID=3445260 RepID=UPI003F209F03
MNLKEALEVLKKEGIATHIETVRRWVRKGDIKATINGNYRQGGYEVNENDLQDFIIKKKAESTHDSNVTEIELKNLMIKELMSKYFKKAMGEIINELAETKGIKDFDGLMSVTNSEEFKQIFDIRSQEITDFLFSLGTDQLRALYDIEVKIK